jgi:hypothetical protein
MTPEEANRFEKAVRFATALKSADALEVPAALVALEKTGDVGIHLVDVCWWVLAGTVSRSTGHTETAPTTSREQIVRLCEVWQSP